MALTARAMRRCGRGIQQPFSNPAHGMQATEGANTMDKSGRDVIYGVWHSDVATDVQAPIFQLHPDNAIGSSAAGDEFSRRGARSSRWIQSHKDRKSTRLNSSHVK